MTSNRLFLFSGLSLLLIAIVIRWQGVSYVVWVPTFCIAILLKAIFLINVFRSKGFKMSLWLELILAGVVMILLSLLFKYIFPIPLLRNIFFCGAIILKVSGLVLMLVQKIKFIDNGNRPA